MEYVCLKIRLQAALNDMQMLFCLYPEITTCCFSKRIFKRIQGVFAFPGLQKGGKRGPKGGPRGVREGSEFSELSYSGPESCKK